MRIDLNDDGTYDFTVTTDEDRVLLVALVDANMVGKKIKYGGRSGEYTDPNFHLFLEVAGKRLALREDAGNTHLHMVRNAIFFGTHPTLVSLTVEPERERKFTLGIVKCEGCGAWKHGFGSHCGSCVEKCTHEFKRQWIISPNLGQAMACSCVKCGSIEEGDLARLQAMTWFDRVAEVAAATKNGECLYPVGIKGPEFDSLVDAHRDRLKAAFEQRDK